MATHSKFIDLDKVVTKTICIKFGGKEYVIPRSIPTQMAFDMMDLFDRMNQAEKDEEGNAKTSPHEVNQFFEAILGVLSIHHPELTLEELKGQLSFQQVTFLIRELSSELFAMEEEAGNP